MCVQVSSSCVRRWVTFYKNIMCVCTGELLLRAQVRRHPLTAVQQPVQWPVLIGTHAVGNEFHMIFSPPCCSEGQKSKSSPHLALVCPGAGFSESQCGCYHCCKHFSPLVFVIFVGQDQVEYFPRFVDDLFVSAFVWCSSENLNGGRSPDIYRFVSDLLNDVWLNQVDQRQTGGEKPMKEPRFHHSPGQLCNTL